MHTHTEDSNIYIIYLVSLFLGWMLENYLFIDGDDKNFYFKDYKTTKNMYTATI